MKEEIDERRFGLASTSSEVPDLTRPSRGLAEG